MKQTTKLVRLTEAEKHLVNACRMMIRTLPGRLRDIKGPAGDVRTEYRSQQLLDDLYSDIELAGDSDTCFDRLKRVGEE